MLFCFSIAGFCKTTITDLSENSNQNKEVVFYTDVVEVDSFVSAYTNVVVGKTHFLQVPTLLKDIYTTSNFVYPAVKVNADVFICIRDKIRGV